tara:strand:- start:5604 stop:6359 length:756 start_codon:yes stop_codon:yes gene_type:complete
MIKNTLLVLFILLSESRSFAQISEADFELVVRAFHAEYDTELKAKNQSIVVNPASNPQMVGFWWKLDEIRAAYSSMVDSDTNVQQHYLFLMGGYARMKGMTRDGVAATLCHELGHGLGGAPFKNYEHEETNVSVEGQADYFAFRYCLPRIFKRLPTNEPVKPMNAYTDSQCKTLPASSYEFCTRAFQTLQAERTFFKLSPDDPNTEFDKHDTSMATKVNKDPYYYPSSQCRLDTMMNGILGKERPSCWYIP